MFSKELKLCTWRLVVSEHTSIIFYSNSSLNTRLHVQSFSNSSMTTSQHVNIQLQFSASSEVYMNVPFKSSQVWCGNVPLPMIGLSCYADLSCNNIAIRNEAAVRRSNTFFFHELEGTTPPQRYF